MPSLPASKQPVFADKSALLAVMDKQKQLVGHRFDATASAWQARQSMLQDGIDPSDNTFTKELMTMRYGVDAE